MHTLLRPCSARSFTCRSMWVSAVLECMGQYLWDPPSMMSIASVLSWQAEIRSLSGSCFFWICLARRRTFTIWLTVEHVTHTHTNKTNTLLLRWSSSWNIEYFTSLKFSLKKLKVPLPQSPYLATSQMLHEKQQLFTFSHESINQCYLRDPQNTLLHACV